MERSFGLRAPSARLSRRAPCGSSIRKRIATPSGAIASGAAARWRDGVLSLSHRASDPGLESWGEQRVLVGRRPVFSPGGPAELHAGGAGVTPQLPPDGSVG